MDDENDAEFFAKYFDQPGSPELNFRRRIKLDEMYDEYVAPALNKKRKFAKIRWQIVYYTTVNINNKFNRACLRTNFRNLFMCLIVSGDPHPKSDQIDQFRFNRTFLHTATHFGLDLPPIRDKER